MSKTWREVRDRIREGNFKMNGNALAYFNKLEESERGGGEHGLKIQIVYIFINIKAEKGIQQTIKKELTNYAMGIKP